MLVETNNLAGGTPPTSPFHLASSRGSELQVTSHTPVNVESRLAETPPHILIRSISSLSQHSLRPRTPEVKVNLASVDSVEWQDRRGGPLLALSLPREGRILLRTKSSLELWYKSLRDATNSSKLRRIALRRGTSTTHLNQITNNNFEFGSSLKGLHHGISDSTPEIAKFCDSECQKITSSTETPKRFSLMSEVDVASYDTDVGTPSSSSVTSSNKFSSTAASSTSGSGGSSVMSSVTGSGGWPIPVRPNLIEIRPRSRFSLYEGPKDLHNSTAKNRYSVCLDPPDGIARRKYPLIGPIRASITDLSSSRTSLSMEPRNPLVELIESAENGSEKLKLSVCRHPLTSSAPRGAVDSANGYVQKYRPRSQSSTNALQKGLPQRNRTNLPLVRHNGLFK